MQIIEFILLLFALFNQKTLIRALLSEDNCTALQNEFAAASSNFTSCGVMYSRPIKLCEMCVDPFIELTDVYAKMGEKSSNETTSCKDYFVNQDRLQIVETLYENSVNLWNKAKCYECFELKDGHLTNNVSSETEQFMKYYNATESCLNVSIADHNITWVCANCYNDYVTLDNYYKSISDENEKIGVCMDIVDLMNNTRKYWGENCCKFRKHDETIFLVCAGLLLLLTIVFYVLAQWCVEKKVPTVFQQPRFVESLSSQST